MTNVVSLNEKYHRLNVFKNGPAAKFQRVAFHWRELGIIYRELGDNDYAELCIVNAESYYRAARQILGVD